MFGVTSFNKLCGPAQVQFVMLVVTVVLCAVVLLTSYQSKGVKQAWDNTFRGLFLKWVVLPAILVGWILLLASDSLCRNGHRLVAWALVLALPTMQVLAYLR